MQIRNKDENDTWEWLYADAYKELRPKTSEDKKQQRVTIPKGKGSVDNGDIPN